MKLDALKIMAMAQLLAFMVTFTLGPSLVSSQSLLEPGARTIDFLRQRILPGTLWCGLNNIAPNGHTISSRFPKLDNCCRDHDLCRYQVKAGECFVGNASLCNDTPFTVLDCECEAEFEKCLSSLSRWRFFGGAGWKERMKATVFLRGYFDVLSVHYDKPCLRKKAVEGHETVSGPEEVVKGRGGFESGTSDRQAHGINEENQGETGAIWTFEPVTRFTTR